jgi:hypothetical protein
MSATATSRIALAAVLVLTALLGGRGLSDPASVMLGADMSRYMMNGAFVHDLIRDGGVWSYADLTRYAEHYFARYPALTLGHHPPVPYLAVVPFYALFGVSVLAARLTALGWFLLAVWALYRLGTRLYDWRVGAAAAALFVTNVMALRAGQHLLSEMPMVALVLVAVDALIAWRDTRRPGHLAVFLLAATAGVYAKQLAVLMFPTYAAILIATLGRQALANRRILWMTAGAALLAVPMIAMSVELGPSNIALAATNLRQLLDGTREASLPAILRRILTTHLTPPALVALALAVAVMSVRRPRATAVVVSWIAAAIVSTAVLAGTVEPARYAFGALPAYYLLIASTLQAARTPAGQRAVLLAVVAVLVVQAWSVRNVRPSGAGGYEDAARFVADTAREPVALYHGVVDTGYFVFFSRVHDPGRRLIVLRGEKLFAPPRAGDATTPDEVYALLQRHGVQHVVVEDREAETPVLRLLHQVLRGDRFVERRRIPIVSREPGMRGVDLLVYEYRDARPADADATVDIGVWRAGRTITVPMRDLTGGGRER